MKYKTKTIGSLATFLLILLVLVVPLRGHAQDALGYAGSFISGAVTSGIESITSLPATLINYVGTGLAYLLAMIASVFFKFGAFLITTALEFNSKVITGNLLVENGWSIVRDIANLGFVLLIIIIAIATILRIQQYGVSKLLPKMIAAAIIVNFSLTIAGVILDFSNVLTNFFLNRIDNSGNSLMIATDIAGAFNPQQFLLTTSTAMQGATTANSNVFEALINSILNLVFIAVFTTIAAFTLIVFGLLLLVRYLYLSFLLVVSPIIWLFWAFPGLGGQFSKWWHSFFKWAFYAPASAFFIYLALRAVSSISSGNAGPTINSGGLIDTVLSKGATMFVLSGIMLGGIIMANQMGIAGASGALSIASKAKSATLGYVGRKTARVAVQNTLGTQPVKKITERMQTFGQNSRFSALARPIREMGTGLAKARIGVEKQVENEKKKLPKGVDEQARQFTTKNNAGRAAILDNIGKKAKEEMDEHTKRAPERKAKREASEANVTRIEEELKKAVFTDQKEEITIRLERAKADLEKAKEDEAREFVPSKDLKKVLDQLPAYAHKALKDAGYEAKRTTLGKRFGVGQYIMLKESNAQKLEAMMKTLTEEESASAKLETKRQEEDTGKKA